jgi:pyruvate/2-oxoglutarate dehydrogenase complex dihydrolipoamide dehydrogenase (E3) component
MARMRRVRERIGRRISAGQLTSAGIDVYFGEAKFSGPDMLVADDEKLRFKKALIATGSRPVTPDIPGIAEVGYLTNETIFNVIECPPRLLVIGGGPQGYELAQAFCRLGSQVTVVQNEPMFLRQEERDAAQILSDALARDGIEIHLNTRAVSARPKGKQKLVELVSDEHRSTVSVDEILVGVGRAPNVENMNLDIAGVHYDVESGIAVNDFLQTTNPHIYAAGDVCFEHTFIHIEDASSRIVVQNALFLGQERLSDLTIPWCTSTLTLRLHTSV